jgi:hypothetical protein
MKNSPLIIPAVFVLLFCTSCGNKYGLAPVNGKVTYNGSPAVGANVYFHPKSPLPKRPKGELEYPIPMATVAEDGSFALSSGDLGSGAFPGDYKVLIEWRKPDAKPAVDPASNDHKTAPPKGEDKFGHLPSDQLKGKYFNLEKPLLSAEVKEGGNKLPTFELTD